MQKSLKDINPSKVEEFITQIRGDVVLQNDKQYDNARQVYNAMIDKYPSLIAYCQDVTDVRLSVNFARDNNLLLAIRGGGHNGGGLGICNDGVVIDLSRLKNVRVDTSDNTVRVAGGNLWGEVDHVTHSYGLAIPAGIISTTGVGGLTLGGGVGYLSRKFGLTIDNLLEADMVLADGSLVTTNKDCYPELFWAIRGGGGNFGIVTSFKFQAHLLSTVIGGPTLWPIEQTEEIMEWYHQFIHNAPEDLNGFIATMVIPGDPFPSELHDKAFCGIVWCYTGDSDRFESDFKEVRSKSPIFEFVGEMPYPAIQTLFDGLLPPGLQFYWRGDYFKDLGAEVKVIHREFGSKIPTPLSQMHMYPLSGAAARVSNTDTPWAYRDAKYAGVIVGIDPDPTNAEKITHWCKSYWEALHPYSAGGSYSNFMMEEGQERVQACYQHNYPRLLEIKTKYDPDNLFRVNQNIRP
ncbi:FAD-binding oxidoreductase [Carboxylicivirga mesophila]|uniref:FAD-binding oxidoreductase n=1 Tax=Carboxylicivirga mesophila TaxID=1166478 RepID=A0ABS5K9Q2_9BACT|nr:FAD-binding oxidoreductase [Carboxylicivirga mesophila]MBS2211754.1 FAD-binding oxidoreductase [Carboxylicivirga mesophila]